MIRLNNNPTLSDYQAYIQQQCTARGWTDRTDTERVMMLAEEVGEIAKEVRKHSGKFGYDKPSDASELGEELVDAFNWLVDLANANDIDLETAFRSKWAKTDKRTWPNER